MKTRPVNDHMKNMSAMAKLARLAATRDEMLPDGRKFVMNT